MKANELRIGNYVQFNFTDDIVVQEVWTINQDNHKLGLGDIGKDVACTCRFSEIEPIPLTEEWLLKFGFEKKTNEEPNVLSLDYILKHYRKEFWLSPFAFDLDQPIVEEGYLFLQRYDVGLGLNEVNEVYYVHELQNIYHCLTGEELTLKPQKQDYDSRYYNLHHINNNVAQNRKTMNKDKEREEKTVEELNSNVNQLIDERRTLSDSLGEAESLIQSLKAENERLLTQAIDAEKNYAFQIVATRKKTKEIEQLKAELKELREDKTDLRNKLDATANILAQEQNHNKKLREGIENKIKLFEKEWNRYGTGANISYSKVVSELKQLLTNKQKTD